MKELFKIQLDLKAPKWQTNHFWKYKYRSCEDILESVKPLLKENECTLRLFDEIILIWERYYVKATAVLMNKEWVCIETTAYAREEESKKGMDWSQITGASSSYARKYALNGLFAIDDTKDSDWTNTHWKEEKIKDLFDIERLTKLQKRAQWKWKEEVMQYVLKAQKDFDMTIEMKEELDKFLSSLS